MTPQFILYIFAVIISFCAGALWRLYSHRQDLKAIIKMVDNIDKVYQKQVADFRKITVALLEKIKKLEKIRNFKKQK